MIGMITIINTLILEKETNRNNFNPITIMAPIYQEEYIVDKLYVFIGNFIGLIVILPLIFNFSRQVSQMVMEE